MQPGRSIQVAGPRLLVADRTAISQERKNQPMPDAMQLSAD